MSLVAACLGPPGDLLEPESGGEGTTDSSNRDAFGNAARNLSSEERRMFEVGDSFFTQNWVTAPASTEARDGLGPLFNAQACASCHVRDGRGSPEAGEIGLLFRLGLHDGEAQVPEPVYGGQFQDRGILGVPAEGTVTRLFVDEPGAFGDGETFTLRRPVFEFEDLAYGPISVDVTSSPRLAPPVFGSGLLEAIPEQDILGAADPDDADEDGISGRPNMVLDALSGEMTLGRFGWKANVASVEEQVAAAFVGDIGITSDLFPDEACTDDQVACMAAPGGGDPEIPADRLEKVVFYSRTLAVPARRGLESPRFRQEPNISSTSNARAAISLVRRQGSPPSMPSTIRSSSHSPISCSTTWAPTSPTVALMARRPGRSGGRHLCGASASPRRSPVTPSSSTMEGREPWKRRSCGMGEKPVPRQTGSRRCPRRSAQS